MSLFADISFIIIIISQNTPTLNIFKEYQYENQKSYYDKCKTRNKDLNNVVYNYKIFSIAEDDRPLFVYCEDAEDITPVIEFVSPLNRQVFVAITSNKISSHSSNIQTAFVV